MPVRPWRQNSTGMASEQNASRVDLEAAGLINGEELDASQEGRCVVCG